MEFPVAAAAGAFLPYYGKSNTWEGRWQAKSWAEFTATGRYLNPINGQPYTAPAKLPPPKL